MRDKVINIDKHQVIFRYDDNSYGFRINNIPINNEEDVNTYIYNETCKIREDESFKLHYEYFKVYVDSKLFGTEEENLAKLKELREKIEKLNK